MGAAMRCVRTPSAYRQSSAVTGADPASRSRHGVEDVGDADAPAPPGPGALIAERNQPPMAARACNHRYGRSTAASCRAHAPRIAGLSAAGAWSNMTGFSWAAGLGAGRVPGMPGARAHPPGRRRRGCRRRLRTARIARSRRSATGQSRRAGRVRSRHEGLPRPARRTGASCFSPAAECALGQEAVPDPLQGQRVGAAGATPVERVGGQLQENLTGEGVVARMQRRELAR